MTAVFVLLLSVRIYLLLNRWTNQKMLLLGVITNYPRITETLKFPYKLYSQDFSYQWAGRTILLSAQLIVVNLLSAQLTVTNLLSAHRFVHFSFSRNPQKNCNKPTVSDIQSHENNVCDRFVSLEQNSSQLSWETMTYFQPSPLRGSGWECHCFSLQLRWILFSRDETVANVILMTLNIRNYRFIAIFLRISTKLKMDKSIVGQ